MQSNKHRVVVVGNGMVGHRVCQSLTDHPEHGSLEIIAIGEEPRPPYDRVHLSEYFSGRSADDLLGLPVDWIPTRVSLAYDEILEGVREGRIKALWIVATNTAHSWIDSHSLADFQIFRLIADRLGLGAPFDRWKEPEDVFDSMKALSRGRPCDLTGIRDYPMLDEQGGVQWPLLEAMAATAFDTERRLFSDGVFFREGGRALFAFEAPRPVAEPVDEEFPFVLLTGRGTSAQWHTETRTGKSSVLASLRPSETRLQMHPEDIARLGLEGASRSRCAHVGEAFGWRSGQRRRCRKAPSSLRCTIRGRTASRTPTSTHTPASRATNTVRWRLLASAPELLSPVDHELAAGDDAAAALQVDLARQPSGHPLSPSLRRARRDAPPDRAASRRGPRARASP